MKQRIMNDMKAAMRNQDRVALGNIRLLRAAIQRRELDSRQTLDNNGVLQVIEKLIKQGKDADEQFSAAGRHDLAKKEQAMIALLQHYLPTQIDEATLRTVIAKAIKDTAAVSLRDMGKVMAVLKPQLAGKADMSKVSSLIKLSLNPASGQS